MAAGLIQLRRPELADASALSGLINAIIAERRWLASSDDCSQSAVERMIQRSLDEPMPFSIATGPELIGWCNILPHPRSRQSHGGLLSIGVAAEHRGQGLGSRLLADCLQQAEQGRWVEIELEVYADHQAAIALYQNHGFEPMALQASQQRPGRPGRHDVLMMLREM